MTPPLKQQAHALVDKLPESATWDDLAYEAEVSRSYLSQLEKGAFYASLKIIGKLAAALGVEPAELLKRGAPENRRS